MTRITVYQHAIGDWRWRITVDGQTIMSPAGMYETEHEARLGAFRIKAIAPAVPVYSAEGQLLFADAPRQAHSRRDVPATGQPEEAPQPLRQRQG